MIGGLGIEPPGGLDPKSSHQRTNRFVGDPSLQVRLAKIWRIRINRAEKPKGAVGLPWQVTPFQATVIRQTGAVVVGVE